MRWFGRIGLLLLILVLGIVAWMALGSGVIDDAPPPTVAETDGRVIDGNATPAPSRTELPPRRRHAATTAAERHDRAPPSEPTGVTGIVLEELEDDVVARDGATVRLFVDGNDLTDTPDAVTTIVATPVASTITDDEGRFAFDITPGTPWRLHVTTTDGKATHARGVGPEDAGELYLYSLERARVTVTDESGQQLRNAYAYLYMATTDSVPYGIAEAGADGVIDLNPAPGNIVVTAPGHGIEEVSGPTGDEKVTLSRGMDLAGVVMDEEGTPLAGIWLSIDDGPERMVRADHAGRFRFERVSEQDEVYLSVHVDGRQVPRLLGYGDLDARVVVPRRGDIAGVVVYADGSPAVGVRVQGIQTDEEGRFVLWTDDRSAAITLLVRVMGRVPGFGGQVETHAARERVEMRPGRTTDVRLVLEESPYSFVNVRRLSPDGTSLRSGSIHLVGAWFSTQSTGDTTLLIVGVEPGTELTLRVGDSQSRYTSIATTVVTSPDSQVPPIEARLGAAEPVALRVFDSDGDEVPRGGWTCVRLENGVLLPNGHIQAAVGAYVHIVVEVGGRRLDRRVNLPTEAPHEIRLRFPKTVRVRGRLLRGDGRAARDLDIVVAPFADMGLGTYLRGTPATDGTFAIDDVPSGRALFVVWQNDGEVQAQRRVIEVPETGELDLGEMLAWDDIVLEGRVSVPPGDSAGGLTVDVYWDEGREYAHALTWADGSFRIRVPGVPDALVTAGRRGRLFGLQPIDLAHTRRVDVRVTRVGRVRIHVSESWRVRGFDVYIVTPDGNHVWAPDCDWIDGGRTVIAEDVPSGTWLLRVVHAKSVLERTIQVTPGEETTVHFDR